MLWKNGKPKMVRNWKPKMKDRKQKHNDVNGYTTINSNKIMYVLYYCNKIIYHCIKAANE